MKLVEYCWFSLKSPVNKLESLDTLLICCSKCAETEQRVWIECKLNKMLTVSEYIFFGEIDSDSFWQQISHRNLFSTHSSLCIHTRTWTFTLISIHEKRSVVPAQNELESVVQNSQIDVFHFIKWMFSGSNNSSCPQH